MNRKSILIGLVTRLLFLPSGILLTLSLQWNGLPFLWVSALYACIALSVLGRLGFDRRYFRFVSIHGIPVSVFVLSCSASVVGGFFWFGRIEILPMAACVPVSLLLSVRFKSKGQFLSASVFDVQGISLFLTLAAFLPPTWFALSPLTLLFGVLLCRPLFAGSSFDLARKSLRIFGVISAFNSCAGFLFQGIFSYFLAHNVSESVAYTIRISERLAFSLTAVSTSSLVFIQYLVRAQNRAKLLRFIRLLSVGFSFLCFLLILLVDSFSLNLKLGTEFYIFSLLYFSTLLVIPVGVASDQLGFGRAVFASNFFFGITVFLFSFYGFPVLAICAYILSIFFERFVVSLLASMER